MGEITKYVLRKTESERKFPVEPKFMKLYVPARVKRHHLVDKIV